MKSYADIGSRETPFDFGYYMKKSKHHLIAERIHYDIFCLLRPAFGSKIAYNMASGYCEVFEREVK